MGGMVTIFDPQGNRGEIPEANLAAAVKAGAMPGVAVQAPDGTIGHVPANRYRDAAAAGGKILPFEQQDVQHPGFWSTLVDDVKGMAHLPSGVSPYPGMEQEAKSAAATQAAQQDQSRKAAGYSPAYRALAPVAQSVGANVPGMEQSAKEGDVAGVAGHAAAAAAPIVAGEAISQGARPAASVLRSGAEAARPAVATALRTAADMVNPDLVGVASPRAAHAIRLAGRLADALAKPETVYPGASLPASPPPELLQGQALAQGGSAPPPEPSAGLAQIPVSPVYPGASEPAASYLQKQSAPISRTLVEKQLNDALGGKPLQPGVSLRNQMQAPSAGATKLPQGFTPVDSTALKGYKYDPTAREFESITSGDQRYIHGDVSPEEAQAFEDADSKGRAWQQIRQNPLVAKVVNGKRISMMPAHSTTFDPAGDLTQILQDSLKQAQEKRSGQ